MEEEARFFIYQNKYDEASGPLQEDSDDVFSRLLLAWSYEHHEGKAAAQLLKGSILQQHNMDIDLALVQREITDHNYERNDEVSNQAAALDRPSSRD